MGRRAKPNKVKAEAKRPLAGKSPKNEGSRVRDLEKRLAEALGQLQTRNRELAEAQEQQTATGEILRTISRLPTDVQPTLDAIAKSAARLCGATDAVIRRVEDGQLRRVAQFGSLPVLAETEFLPLDPSTGIGQAVVERRTVHIHDMLEELARDKYPGSQHVQRRIGVRTTLAVPLVKNETVIGGIVIRRTEVHPFTDQQIALLKTFADQAVIAIENVRLFNELQEKNRALTAAHAQVTEALNQQTATSEILKVISSSPTDVRPVFDTIIRNAVRLCDAIHGGLYQFDGERIHLAADFNFSGQAWDEWRQTFPRPLSSGGGLRHVIETGNVLNVTDFEDYEGFTAAARAWFVATGIHSVLFVPMLRQHDVIGAIVVNHRNAGAFSDAQVALLQTFADQAVIAIENVRLFTELQASNRELTTALDTQTATSDILRVISRSQTDVQPVFDAIVESAVRLLRGFVAAMSRLAGDRLELVAFTSTDPVGDAAVRSAFPQALHSDWPHARVVRNRVLLNVADARSDSQLPEAIRKVAVVRGYQSLVVVPLLRHDEAIGAISLTRREPGEFTDDEISLLQTFADQAVIAIENARLLSELQARTQALTRSVGELQALGEVGQAISSTLDLQTVLSTIVARATQLAGADAGVIYEYDEPREVFMPRATEHLEAAIVETMLSAPVRKGEGATGRLAEVPEPTQVPDILEAPAESRVRGSLVRAGYRALLAVPLVREDRLLGGLTVIRKATGAFAPEVIELLRTFATQSALAIQNARLFLEIEDKSRQLEAASQHKSEFLANMSHELRTPLNAIIGFSEVLTERMFGELNDKQDEYLKDIYASGQHLLSLINDILDLSKIEAGRMELEPADFDLPGAIDNALTLIRERAGRRGIALGSAIDERVGTIRADERKVKQVLLNLLSNAIKFTPEGGRIDVRAAVNDGMVEVSVADTGVGIAPEDQEAVFEEFRQVGTADKKVEGTGLGLALSRKFIELHGGRIWVTSQVGTGSTFTFTIPVRANQATEEAPLH
jgi:signal transduction histidine kinase/putative methionine-R-sulfoxide reductase with GAF domain